MESSEIRSIEGTLGSWFQLISEEDKSRYDLPTDMAEYVHTHFETYVEEADLKLQILVKNLEPDNLGQVKN